MELEEDMEDGDYQDRNQLSCFFQYQAEVQTPGCQGDILQLHKPVDLKCPLGEC